jgi:glycosyltransferase involved in cell wall biosynthesis
MSNIENSEKMTIVFMNSIPAHIWRGGEKWMVNAADGLHGRGHTVVCIGKKNAVWLDKAKARGVTVKPMNIHADFSPLIISKLVAFFLKIKPDVVCCNFEKDVRLGGIAARIAGVRVVYVRKGLSLLCNKLRYRLAYKYFADRVISPSHFIKDNFKQYTWLAQDRIDVVHNGVEIPDTSKFDKNKILSLCDGPIRPVLFGAGSLFWQKGFEYLIEAVSLLNKKGYFPHAVIAGEGDPAPYKELAVNYGVDKYIHFAGHRSDIPELMYGSDIFVLSSIDEGLPNVVLEAMAVGTAVVASDAGGTKEIITDGQNGYIVPVKSAGALAEKIELLLSDESLRSRIAKAGFDSVKEQFTIEKNVEGVERLFLKSLTPRPPLRWRVEGE